MNDPNGACQTAPMRSSLRSSSVRRLVGGAALVTCAVAIAPRGAGASTPTQPTPRVGHVWVFVFENTNFDAVTAASMPYFSEQAAKGLTLSKMYGVGHASLTNYIAMASGHAPVPKTQADCFSYDCVFEAPDDDNLASQLQAAGLDWRGYFDGAPGPCPIPPNPGTGDPYIKGYATRHNPFMYYRRIVADTAGCAERVRPYTDMAKDLAAEKVAQYTLVVPDTCNDAHDGGEQCGLTTADNWLKAALPPILNSKAYRDGGAVVLTFDEATIADASNCCGSEPAGGHIATAILSPRLAKPGTVDDTPYSHYSLLRTIEENFGLPLLRHAADASTNSMLAAFVAAPTPETSTSAASTTTVGADKESDAGPNAVVTGAIVGAVAAVGAFFVLRARKR